MTTAHPLDEDDREILVAFMWLIQPGIAAIYGGFKQGFVAMQGGSIFRSRHRQGQSAPLRFFDMIATRISRKAKRRTV